MLTRTRHLTPLLVLAALSSAGAGVIHAAAAPEHSSWTASIFFFVGLAVFQLAWAAYVLAQRPGTVAAALGGTVNLAALGVWMVSRTSGLPFGPHQGVAESASRADLIACALSLIVVVGAVGIVRRWDRQPVARLRVALSMSAGGLTVSALSVFALTGVAGHAHSAEGEHGQNSPIDAQVVSTVQELAPTGGVGVELEPAASHPEDGHSH